MEWPAKRSYVGLVEQAEDILNDDDDDDNHEIV